MVSDPTFVLLSFEGPDHYSRAGGLGSRVTELSRALAGMGFETHLFFIGAPDLPGHEVMEEGHLHLHRWCQWISAYYPAGVYDGEEDKLRDWEHSLPVWLEKELLEPKLARGGSVVVLAEEWQTVGTIVALHQVVLRQGWQDRVHLVWNANNTFSFHRIDWEGLRRAGTITTVSRYMKHRMWNLEVDARVIPNGIPEDWLQPVDRKRCASFSQLFRERVVLVKVARWDPDKRWLMAVDAVAQLKRLGMKPLLLARGGVEAHGSEVLARAQEQGLRVQEVQWEGRDAYVLHEALRSAIQADLIVLQSSLSEEQSRVLFHVADAVLANSGIEPFGLVGLETMAARGIALVGSTGEDYATPGYDAIALQTNDPREIVHHVVHLQRNKHAATQLRQAARRSAERYTWPAVIRRALLPALRELGVHVTVGQEAPKAPVQRFAETLPPLLPTARAPMVTPPLLVKEVSPTLAMAVP